MRGFIIGIVVWFVPTLAHAQFVANSSANFILNGTGLDINLQPNPTNGQVNESFTAGAGETLSQHGAVESWASGHRADGVTGLARFGSHGFVFASFENRWRVGLRVLGEAEGGWAFSPTGGASARVTVRDTLRLVYEGTGPAPPLPSQQLLLTFYVSGSLGESTDFVDPTGLIHETVFSTNVLSTSAQWFGIVNDSVPIGEYITAQGTLAANGTLQFIMTIVGGARVSFGFVNVFADQTVTLTGVTFPDGTTPESHGFTLEFASGVPSPNLIPEPTSMLLAALAPLTLVCARGRRRKELVLVKITGR